MTLETLTELFVANQAVNKTITYIYGADDEQNVSYSQLYNQALGLLGIFQERGLLKGDELILYIDNNKSFLDAFWACLLGGIIPVPVAIGVSDEHRAKIIRIYTKLKQAYLYTDRRQMQHLLDYAGKNDCSVTVETMRAHCILIDDIAATNSAGKCATVRPDDTAFIQFSSGSTSDPKGVVLSHRNIMTNVNAISDRDRLNENDIALSWMPLTHDMGLIGYHLAPFANKMNHCIMSTAVFSRRPLLWLKKISQHRATLSNSPNFGYKHVLKVYQHDKLADIDLSTVRMLDNGAEPISVQLYEQFLDAMAAHGLQRTAMHTVYGLAEASLAVALPDPRELPQYISIDRHHLIMGEKMSLQDDAHPDSVRLALLGPVVQDCFLSIADSKHNTLPAETVGEIRIKGDNVTSGYYGDAYTTKALISDDGWLNTGDVGFMYQDQLVVTGRIKDIIFVNGQNYYPYDIEAVVLRHVDLELGKVIVAGVTQDIADNNELLVFVLYRSELNEFIGLANAVSRTINEYVGLEVAHVIPVNRIPKTTSGKIQRHKLVEAYLQGEWDEQLKVLGAGNMPSSINGDGNLSTTEQQLLTICQNTIEGKTIGIHDNLFEIGISSIVLSEIHQQIEDLYPEQVDITDLFDHQTIAELADFIDSD